jgi:hypothetical protein
VPGWCMGPVALEKLISMSEDLLVLLKFACNFNFSRRSVDRSVDQRLISSGLRLSLAGMQLILHKLLLSML